MKQVSWILTSSASIFWLLSFGQSPASTIILSAEGPLSSDGSSSLPPTSAAAYEAIFGQSLAFSFRLNFPTFDRTSYFDSGDFAQASFGMSNLTIEGAEGRKLDIDLPPGSGPSIIDSRKSVGGLD